MIDEQNMEVVEIGEGDEEIDADVVVAKKRKENRFKKG